MTTPLLDLEKLPPLSEEDAAHVRSWLLSALPSFDELSLPAMAEVVGQLLWQFGSWSALAGRGDGEAAVLRIAERVGQAACAEIPATSRDVVDRAASRAAGFFLANPGASPADFRRSRLS